MSIFKNYLNLKNQNKIPLDIYNDDIYVYSIFSSTGQEVLTLEDIYNIILETSDQPIKIFTIRSLGLFKGKFGNDEQREITSLKTNNKIRSSIEIPNLNTSNIDLSNIYLFSKTDLTDFIDETNEVKLPLGQTPFISTGLVNIGKDGTFFSKLQAFQSYQFNANNSEGKSFDVIIKLNFEFTQGINVKSLKIERWSYYDASRNLVVVEDDNNNSINWNHNFEKSDNQCFGDLDHIEISKDPNNQIEVFSHTFSTFRLIDYMLENKDAYLGVHPNFKIKTGEVGGSFADNYRLNKNNESNQLKTEWVNNGKYYRFVASFVGPGKTDFAENWKDGTNIEKIIPQNSITNASMINSITKERTPINSNPNNNEEFWFKGDYKNVEVFIFPEGRQKYGVDFTLAKSIKEEDFERSKILFNNFLNGSLITYKGLTLNELPDILETQDKGEYQNFKPENQEEVDFYVATSYDLYSHFLFQKRNFDLNNPIQKNAQFVYNLNNLYKTKKDWPTNSGFQKLRKEKSFLFQDKKIITQVIDFDEEIKFKSFSNRAIGGGSKIRITQLDSDGNLSKDSLGREVSPITIPTSWFLNKNQSLTNTSFSFISNNKIKINNYKKK